MNKNLENKLKKKLLRHLKKENRKNFILFRPFSKMFMIRKLKI